MIFSLIIMQLIIGYYKNGNDKTICIKNITPENIESYILDLRNQIGRKVSFNLHYIFYIYNIYS